MERDADDAEKYLQVSGQSDQAGRLKKVGKNSEKIKFNDPMFN